MTSNAQVLRTISLQSPSTPGQSKYILFKRQTLHTKLHDTTLHRGFLTGLVTIPLQNTKMATSKAGETMMTKTIQLTSAQMVENNFGMFQLKGLNFALSIYK